MADYHIYLTSVNSSGSSSQTTPWQLKAGGASGNGNADDVIGGGINPSNIVKRGASFLQSPDSLIGSILSTPIGKMGVVAVVAGAVASITDKAISMYSSYASSASGNYKFQIEYNNFKQNLHNFFHPFSTEIQRQYNSVQIKKENLANEQQRLLLGGSILNSPYGRYL